MSLTERGWITAAALATLIVGSQLIPASALADPEGPAQPDPVAEGDQTQMANPTMLPGRIFEANTVLPASGTANMRISIEWPYSANLICEILVDDALVSKAEDFIAPRVLPVKDDPDYGALTCQAPVSGVPTPIGTEGKIPPADPAAPVEPAPPNGPATQPA